MRSYAKVVTLLCLLVVSTLAAGEEDEEMTAMLVEDENKQAADSESSTAEGEGSETKEKRGLFRVTGVLGENPQPYPFVYTVPQAAATQYDPRTAGAAPVQTYIKPFPFQQGVSAQPTYQQPYVATAPPAPFPYSAPTPMILLMMPPHPGNPYGSLMIVPASNFFPQFTPNHIPLPYQAAGRSPVQFVPDYIPVPVKSVPTSHYKGSYPQKPLSVSQASVYQSYQENPSSAEEQDQSTAPSPPNYATRQQYVKG